MLPSAIAHGCNTRFSHTRTKPPKARRARCVRFRRFAAMLLKCRDTLGSCRRDSNARAPANSNRALYLLSIVRYRPLRVVPSSNHTTNFARINRTHDSHNTVLRRSGAPRLTRQELATCSLPETRGCRLPQLVALSTIRGRCSKDEGQ